VAAAPAPAGRGSRLPQDAASWVEAVRVLAAWGGSLTVQQRVCGRDDMVGPCWQRPVVDYNGLRGFGRCFDVPIFWSKR